MEKRKTIYYNDELGDEFSKAQITPRQIDGSYVYVRHGAWHTFTHFFWYRIVATPLAFLYTKIKFHHKVIGREKLKSCSDMGYFIYGNHTQDIADACIPSMLTLRKQTYIIVHPNNVSIPFVGRVTPSLGALPLPDDMAALRNFNKAVEHRIVQKKQIMIYPEAHIWPFCTWIRNFSDASFVYPVKAGTPVFCMTNTYARRRFGKKPRIVTYVDGPFYPDTSLSARAQRKELRDRVYECMCERAKQNEVVVIEYIKKENVKKDD